MKKVKLSLSRLATMVKVAKARQIVTAMTGNVNFPTPNPSLATLTTAANETETAFNNAEDGSNSAQVLLEEKEKALNKLLTQIASYVDNIAAGEETIINSAGMEASDEPGEAGQPETVINLKLADNKNISGSAKASWKKQKAAKIYLAYVAVEDTAGTPPLPPSSPSGPTPGTPATTKLTAMPTPPAQPGTSGYELYDVTTSTKLIITGVPPLKRIWVVVMAIGAGGKSGFSDPATIIVR
ncbi:MAG: hypothetical protein POELPBGB_02441 [Bacteroidia bacterium]|nr:hypothetical protein [Bacteroidia bacterium]